MSRDSWLFWGAVALAAVVLLGYLAWRRYRGREGGVFVDPLPDVIVWALPLAVLHPILDALGRVLRKRGPEAAKSDETHEAAIGTLVYNTPDTMRVMRTYTVEARIARSYFKELEEGMKGDGEPKIEPTQIAPIMIVELMGEDGKWTISAKREKDALLGEKPKEFAQWLWSVTPLKLGRHELELTIYGQTETKDGVVGKDLFGPVVHTITVQVNPAHTAKRVGKWAAVVVAAAILGMAAREQFGPWLGLGIKTQAPASTTRPPGTESK